MKRELLIPNLKIETDAPNDICLMVLGGRAAAPEWLKSISFNTATWAVDKGLDCCFKAGIIPDRLIGDGDSASESSWQHAEELGIPISKFFRDKDFTDFQLALNIFSKSNKRENGVFITSCFGGRFDHLWSTIITFCASKGTYRPIGAADEREGLLFLEGEASAVLTFSKAPEAVSVIPFTEQCTGVSMDGVRWPLNKAVLEYAVPYSISNRLEASNIIKFDVESGTVGIYWKWNEV